MFCRTPKTRENAATLLRDAVLKNAAKKHPWESGGITTMKEVFMPRGQQTRTKKHGARKNRRVTTEKHDPDLQPQHEQPLVTGPAGLANYQEIKQEKWNEFKRGRLFNASGNRVDRPNQAISIAQHEARQAGARNVPGKKKAA
jgi:hypothetical protein